MRKTLLAGVLQTAVAINAIYAAPRPPYLMPTPCPGDDACGAAFNGLCNATTLQGLTGLQPGQKVAVLLPDNVFGAPGNIGYYAHAFSALVGKSGHVYDIVPPELKEDATSGRTTVNGHLVTGDYADTNVTRLLMRFSNLGSLPKLDLVWANNLSYFKPIEASSFISIFNALNSGGRFIVKGTDSQKMCGTARRCPAVGPMLLEDLLPNTVLEDIKQVGFTLVYQSKRIFDPGRRAADYICPRGAFSDGTYWKRYPFLWEFQRRPN